LMSLFFLLFERKLIISFSCIMFVLHCCHTSVTRYNLSSYILLQMTKIKFL